MSEEDEVIRFDGDTSKLNQAIEELLVSLGKLNQGFGAFVPVAQKVVAGSNDVVTTFESVDASLNKITLNVRTKATEIVDSFGVIKSAAQQAAESLEDASKRVAAATALINKGEDTRNRKEFSDLIREQGQAEVDAAKSKAAAAAAVAKAQAAIEAGEDKLAKQNAAARLRSEAAAADAAYRNFRIMAEADHEANGQRIANEYKSKADAAAAVAKAELAIADGQDKLARQNMMARLRQEAAAAADLVKQKKELAVAEKRINEEHAKALQDDARTGRAGRVARGQSLTVGDTIKDTLSSRFTAANLASSAITSGIGLVRREVSQAVKNWLEYEKGLSRIQIVTGKTTQETKALGDSLLKASVKYNLGVSDVQAASLEASRNNNSTKDDPKFLETAFKLAKATGSSAESAVKALKLETRDLSGLTHDAAEAAETLFSAWRVGGSTIEEFSNSAASLKSILTPMNVSLAEQSKLLTVFMQNGHSASSAVGLITGAMIRLNLMMETNKDLQIKLGAQTLPELINRLGSASAAIQAFTGKGVLGAADLSDSAFGQGGLIAIAKYAREVDILSKTHGDMEKAAATALTNVAERWEMFTADIKAKAIAIAESINNIFLGEAFSDNYVTTHTKAVNDAAASLRKTQLETWASAAKRPERIRRNSGGDEEGVSPGVPVLNADEAKRINAAHKALKDALAGEEDERKQIAARRKEAARKEDEEAARPKLTTEQVLYKTQLDGLNKYIQDRRSAWIRSKEEFAEIDKERSSDIKNELDIQLHRFEESVRTQEEVAKRAKDNVKRAQENLAASADAFEEGRFKRQLTVTRPEKLKKRLTENHNASLTQGATDLVDHFSKLTGDEMLNSKDLDNARAKLAAVQASAEENAAKVNALFEEGHGTKKQVLLAEMQIVAAAQKRKDLEEKILGISKAQEKAAKDKADALKLQFDLAKKYVDQALNVKTETKSGPRDSKLVLDEFNRKQAGAEGAFAKAGGSVDAQLALHTKLEEKRQQILEQMGVVQKDAKFSELDAAAAGAKKAFGEVSPAALSATAALAGFAGSVGNLAEHFQAMAEGRDQKLTNIAGVPVNGSSPATAATANAAAAANAANVGEVSKVAASAATEKLATYVRPKNEHNPDGDSDEFVMGSLPNRTAKARAEMLKQRGEIGINMFEGEYNFKDAGKEAFGFMHGMDKGRWPGGIADSVAWGNKQYDYAKSVQPAAGGSRAAGAVGGDQAFNITFNIDGSVNPKATADEMASVLRRLERQGLFKPGKGE